MDQVASTASGICNNCCRNVSRADGDSKCRAPGRTNTCSRCNPGDCLRANSNCRYTTNEPNINAMETANWKTTNPLRIPAWPPLEVPEADLKISVVLNLDRYRAGYNPPVNPASKGRPMVSPAICEENRSETASSNSVSWLNQGSETLANMQANTIATTPYKSASVRNCAAKALRCEPKAFRTPTSRARCMERAVERFIKLTQASNKIKAPTTLKMRTCCRSPSVVSREIKSPESRCNSGKANNRTSSRSPFFRFSSKFWPMRS